MPYRKQAIGKNWVEIEQRTQIIIIALMESNGAANLIIGFMVLILLLIPFRRREVWVNWTLFLGGMILSGLSFFITFKIHLATNASTPWYIFSFIMALILLGFLFSLGMRREGIKT